MQNRIVVIDETRTSIKIMVVFRVSNAVCKFTFYVYIVLLPIRSFNFFQN